jgi:hypothetical protein
MLCGEGARGAEDQADCQEVDRPEVPIRLGSSHSHNSLHKALCTKLAAAAEIDEFLRWACKLLIRSSLHMTSGDVAFLSKTRKLLKWAFFLSGIGEITQGSRG